MSPQSKREYLAAIVKRYRAAPRKIKTAILDEFCSTCGYHRKHALRLLRAFRRFTQKVPAKRGRRPVYDAESLLIPLKRIWIAANLPCSKRLKAIIPDWLPGYYQDQWPDLAGDGGSTAQDIAVEHRQSAEPCSCPVYPVWQGHDQAGNAPQKAYPGQDQPMGRNPTRLPGGRYGSPLRKLDRRHVRQHPRLR